MFALKINDTVVATALCLLREGWLTGQLFAHERGSWRSYSLGHLLTNMICEWCFANRLQVFDFGIGDEPYKNNYCEITIRTLAGGNSSERERTYSIPLARRRRLETRAKAAVCDSL